jgi:serralysin
MAGLGSCGCAVCAGGGGLQYSAEAAETTSSGKPVWSLDQVLANLMRWDARWEAPLSIPFSFYDSPPAHLANASLYKGFVAFDAAQREATRTVLNVIADVANVGFVEVPDDGAQPGPATARLTYARGDWGHANATAAANVNISDTPLLGDAREIHAAEISFNTQRWTGAALPAGREFYVLLHETMHALGFPHPGQYNRTGTAEITFAEHAEYSQDTNQYTVLSYFSASHSGGDHKGAFASTLMLHDIAALQALYGANTTTRAGDTTYGFESTAGRSVYDFALNPRPVMSIWDAGGIDTINLSGFAQAARLDLNAGAFSDVAGMIGNLSVAFGVVIENAITGASADVITGNAAANRVVAGGGDDRVEGRAGNDLLFGNQGADTLEGGDGEDSLFGGKDNDRLSGGAGGDYMLGDLGDDVVLGEPGRTS